MLTERRKHILSLVADAYIRTAHPVPSSLVAERLQVSSATVRNEFGALEEVGLLAQPHASAGRVPTAEGFRLYALAFLPPRKLPAAQRARLVRQLQGARGDELLTRIADAAAAMSGYAVVVSLAPDDSLRTLEIHLSPVGARQLVAVAVFETGLVRQLQVELDPLPEGDVLDDAERDLRQLTLPMREVPSGLRDLARRADEELARTLLALAEAWPALAPPRLVSQGLRNLLAEPESRDPDFLRRVVEEVEASESSPPDEDLGLQLDEGVARVRARFEVGSSHGALTLLGPERMRYPDALMVAGAVRESLGAN